MNAIEQLTQTVLEPAAWPTALRGIVSLVGGDHAVLLTNKQSAMTLPFGVSVGLDAGDIERLASPLARQLIQPLERLLTPGTVSSSADHFSDLELEQTELYNEIIRPANGFYSASVQQDRPDLSFHFSICRPRIHGAFTANEVQRLAILLPHLTAALDLRRRLQIGENRLRGLIDALHSLNEGAIILDQSNLPLIVNARAEKILQRSDGLTLASGGLRASTDVLTSKLSDAIALAGASSTTANQQIYLPRLSPQLPLLLTVVPILRLQIRPPGLGMPRVLILIKELDARSDIDRVALQDIFRLTPRESEIAVLLADGASSKEIASRLELTVGTVRFNVKRIFQKTGTHSQTALVVLVRHFGRIET